MSRSDIERVRDAVNLVTLISEYVPLQQKGREWKGVCPFHDDHAPSMHVVTHRETEFYKCFSCGAYGDCFKFIQEYLKKDFGETLRFLADKYGIELSTKPQDDLKTPRSKLKKAMKWAMVSYQKALKSTPEGANALEQLHARGFTKKTIQEFQLGVSPNDWSYLKDKLTQEQIDTGLQAGLLKQKLESNRVYDAFRHRIMFPILDESGTPIAFGARRLDEKDEPKYLNSPETSLFNKSKTLYGYNLANRPIRESKKAIVVEGYTDVIACHQAGFKNVVATLGTALTSDHADKLCRICNEVVLIFDGDNAGQLAADRAVEIFFKKNIDVLICVLPEGKDPADLASNPEVFTKHLDDAKDALSFKFDRMQDSLSEETTIAGSSNLIEIFMEDLARLGVESLPSTKKTFIYERIAGLLKISMNEVGHELRSRLPVPRPVTQAKEEVQTSKVVQRPVTISRSRQLAEQEFLSILIFDPIESSAAIRESNLGISEEDFLDLSSRKLADFALPKLQAGTLFRMQDILEAVDQETGTVASRLYFVGQRLAETYESVASAFEMTLKALKNTIEQTAIENEIRSVSTLADPEKRTSAAMSAIEAIRTKHNSGKEN